MGCWGTSVTKKWGTGSTIITKKCNVLFELPLKPQCFCLKFWKNKENWQCKKWSVIQVQVFLWLSYISRSIVLQSKTFSPTYLIWTLKPVQQVLCKIAQKKFEFGEMFFVNHNYYFYNLLREMKTNLMRITWVNDS